MRLSRWTNSPFGFEHDRSGGENAAASGAYSGRYAISRRTSRWKAGSRSTARTMSSTGTTSCRPKPVRSRLSLPVPRASSAGSRRLIKWRMCGYISLRVESPWTHAPNSSRAPRRSAGRGPGGAQRSAPVPGVGGAAPAHPYRRRRPRRPPDVRLPADADAAVRAGHGGTASLAHDPASRRFGAHRPRVRRRAAAFLHRDDRAEGGTLAERPHGEGQAQRTPYEEMGRRRPPAAGEPGDPHRRHDALRLGSRQISVSRCPVIPLFRRHDIGLTRDCFDAKPPLMKGGHPPFVARLLWWRFRLNTHSAYRLKSAPVIADGAVFAADDHCNVWRHDLSDGAIRWQYRSVTDRGKGIIQLLQFADASLVFGCYDGTVTRLDARSGKVIWRVRQDSSIHATPAIDVANRRVFVNTEQWNRGSPLGSLLALDWSTGRLVWRYRHRYWAPGSPCYCADDGIVVATCNDGTLACVDAASGERRWEFRTDGLARGRPVVANGRVYAATESGRLHCVSISSGTEEWTIRYGKGRMHLFPRVQSGCVYLLDGQRHLSAFDQDTGALRWISRLRSNGVWCPVSCGDYLVTLSQGGHLSVFDPRCELKVWEDAIGGIYRQPPAIAEGHLAAASNDDGLKVFKIDDFYLR